MATNASIEAVIRLAELSEGPGLERYTEAVRIPLRPSQATHVEEIAAHFNLPLATVCREALLVGLDAIMAASLEGEKNAKRRAK